MLIHMGSGVVEVCGSKTGEAVSGGIPGYTQDPFILGEAKGDFLTLPQLVSHCT